MKRILIGFSILLTFSGCFIYDNTISWEQQPNKPNSYKDLKVTLELNQSQRTLIFPFLFVIYNKNKDFYSPTLHITTVDKNIIQLIDFKFIIFDSRYNKILSDSINNEIKLNNFIDYNALLFDCNKEYFIEGLNEKSIRDSINVDYEITFMYSNGSKQTFYFNQNKLIKTRYKKFGSFL